MIVAHLVVGPGEGDRYLDDVLQRAHSWADQVFVHADRETDDETLDVINTHADAWSKGICTWEDHEGRFRQEAWYSLEKTLPLTLNDWIVCIDADEVIHEYEMIKQVPRTFKGRRVPITFHEIWGTDGEYRIDGQWRPWDGYIMFPYRDYGQFKDRALACGREPTYVATLPPVSKSVANLLHYGYAREADRQWKYDRYMRIDGGKFHNLSHLKSILSRAETARWEKGGLLEVPE